MIHSFKFERGVAAYMTDSGLFFHKDCFRLDSPDKEKHHMIPCI